MPVGGTDSLDKSNTNTAGTAMVYRRLDNFPQVVPKSMCTVGAFRRYSH